MSRLIKYGGEVIMPVTIHKGSLFAASRVKLDLSTIKLEDHVSWRMNGQIFQGEVCGIIRQAEYSGNGGWGWRENIGVDIDIQNRNYLLFVPSSDIHLLTLNHRIRD